MPVPPEAATAWFAAVRKELTIAAAQAGAFCNRARKKPIKRIRIDKLRRPLAELGAFRREPDAGEREIDRHQDPKQRQRIGRERRFPLGRVLLVEVDDGIETVRGWLRGDGVRREAQSGDKNKESDEARAASEACASAGLDRGRLHESAPGRLFEGVAIGAGLNGVRLQARVR